MLVNEHEARELFCPQAFPLIGLKAEHGEGIYTCKGSGCMCWNWLDSKKKGPEQQGYCGLSGRQS